MAKRKVIKKEAKYIPARVDTKLLEEANATRARLKLKWPALMETLLENFIDSHKRKKRE